MKSRYFGRSSTYYQCPTILEEWGWQLGLRFGASSSSPLPWGGGFCLGHDARLSTTTNTFKFHTRQAQKHINSLRILHIDTMVLFDEDPKELLKATTAQFHIAPDRDSLSRISDSLSSLSNARTSRINHQQALLKSLSRRLNGLEEGRRWEEDRHDAGGHAERMLRMDTEKFRVAKGASDAEIEGERLEGELASLKQQLEVLEKQGVEGGWRRDSGNEDEVV